MGSGTTLISAYNNNRRSIGIEVDYDYCDLAKKRIINVTDINQKSLFEGIEVTEINK